ncbi:MAG: hypothetical protein MUP90_08110 [Gammaproteobacteria bacterium]|nr:hypothetical protein [Gammaproteobacteria bacterium]
MQQLLRVYIDIIVLRRGPQDLPASQFLTLSALLLYLSSGLALFLTHVPTFSGALAELSVAVLIEAGFFLILLSLRGKMLRAGQTLSALWGSGALLTFAGLPLHIWMQAQPQEAAAALPGLGLLLLLLLSLVVAGHILREALEIPLPGGILLVLAEFALSIFVSDRLFGGSA